MQDIDGMIDFFIYEKGENIKINGVMETALIIDVTEKLNYYDDKIIRGISEIKTGDIVEYNGFNYLIISQIDKEESSYRARIRKCSYKISFNWNGNVKWFDAIEESKVFDISSGTYLTISTGTINIFFQNNADTRGITLGQRFYVTNQPFKVSGIDKSQDGIIKLYCDLDLISTTYDDVENNIVDRWKYEIGHTYILMINNGDTANVLLNDICLLNITATDNGTAIVNPAITFTSSDTNYVSVDNNGKIMGISLGQSLITAKFTYHNTIYDSITISTVETITHSYFIDITGSTILKIGQSRSYVDHIYDNGSEVFDKSVVWSVRNQDGTTTTPYLTITTSTGNGATVKATSNSAYINKYAILKATISDDATLFKEFIIQIKSLL
ncbi:hypothetical protein [Clostridium sp.]|uniref:hypothetical protein n=1 Tax=Clostridium sp. TaxID=1506 RepID=UPI001A4A82FC|nr:hypothetical protein [Clostridium sp.]MBK5242050.1 hypothetical protein [Clostridium sp.]